MKPTESLILPTGWLGRGKRERNTEGHYPNRDSNPQPLAVGAHTASAPAVWVVSFHELPSLVRDDDDDVGLNVLRDVGTIL